MSGPHVETELLAYLDGELGKAERTRVEAHLAECSACTAELERLRALQKDLGATLHAALAPVRLPAAADRRIRERLRARTEPRSWWGLWQRRGLVTQAVLAALALIFALNTVQVLRVAPPAPQETLVLGQDRLSPGSQAALRVIVRSTDRATPVAGANVVVRIGRAPGLAQMVYTGQTDARGSADVAFTVPQDLEGQASLVVETSSASGADRIERSITVAREYKLLLGSDKPAYRPGQTIHQRALAFDAVTLRPVAGQRITFTILDPSAYPLLSVDLSTDDFGIAASDFALPPEAAHGQYTLKAAIGDTVSERTVTVGAYELPAFRVAVETDRTFYAPGEQVTGSVRAEYFFGKPIAGAQVVLRGYTDEARQQPSNVVLGQTDERGAYEFTFVLPPAFGATAWDAPSPFDLEVEVTDAAGQREGIRHVVPVAAQPILIKAVPESGRLKPSVENVIYILTAYPDGQPAETTLSIRVGGEQYTLATGPYGLAEFRTTPPGRTTQMTVQAQDAQGSEGYAAFTFQAAQVPQTLLLRAERAVYEVGDTLRAEALTAGGVDTVYLDVVRARQTVATLSAPVENGRAVFALDLDGTMASTLELHATSIAPDGSLVQDTRLVVVDMPRRVAVAVTADREEYRPGDTAHLQIQTTLTSTTYPTSQPTTQQTALGIAVVDESVYALETQPPGFVRAYFLLERDLQERQAQGLDVPALLDAEAQMRAAQDVAARAAWAGVSGTGFTLSAKSTTAPHRESARARVVLANRLGLLLALLPLLLSAVVAQGLHVTGVLRRALRRVGIGLLVLFVASPLVALVVGGAMALLWALLGVGAPVAVLAVVVALVIWVAVHGWRRRDARVQLAVGLVAAYLALGGLLVALAAREGEPGGLLLALIVATFLLAVAALAVLGQGLVLEGWRRSGWAATLLALLLIPLVIYLPFVPGLNSGLTRALGNPALYAGPVGWLTGCAPMATTTPETIRETVEAPVEMTMLVEATTAPAVVTPTPAPATPPPPPVEPFPLRQVFPETLYWNAEALTDENGHLTLDLPLADSITTWRLTALASTQDGTLGFATTDIVVFQDLFVDLELPATVTQGETVTATVRVYNYLPQAQTVRLELAPAEWYTVVSSPEAVAISPSDVATAVFSIRPEQVGQFSLQVTAAGERMSDAVAKSITVEP